MSSADMSAVRSNFEDRLHDQQETTHKQETIFASNDETLSHTDLRIVPEGWQVPEGETNPLLHYDLRIVEAKQEPDADV